MLPCFFWVPIIFMAFQGHLLSMFPFNAILCSTKAILSSFIFKAIPVQGPLKGYHHTVQKSIENGFAWICHVKLNSYMTEHK